MQHTSTARRRALGGPIARTHPLTGEPIEPVGIVNGREIWPILGGSEDAGGSEGESGEDGGENADDDVEDETEETSEGQDTGGDDKGKESGTQRQSTAKARSDEAKRHRLNARKAEKERDEQKAKAEASSTTLDAVRKALGLDGDADDPAKAAQTAAEERDAARAEAKALRTEQVVGRIARAAGVNEDALLDSRAFADKVAALDLDPASDEFRDEVAELVKETAEKRPELLVEQKRKAPGSSGSAPGNGGGEKRKTNDVESHRERIRKRRGQG